MRAAPEFNRGEIQHVSVVEIQPEAMLMTNRKTAASDPRVYVQGCCEHKEGAEYAEGKASAPHMPAICEKAG